MHNVPAEATRRATLWGVLNANRLTPLPSAGSATPVAPAAGMGQVLPVHDGQEIAARVLAVRTGGALLALAGRQVEVRTSVPLDVGQTVRMQVQTQADGSIRLRLPEGTQGATPQGRNLIAQVISATLPGQAPIDPPDGLTPLQANAFARLAGSALPTTPTAVAGLATLLQGPTIGTALMGLQAAMQGDEATRAQAEQLARTLAGLTARTASGEGDALMRSTWLMGRALEAQLADGGDPAAGALRSQLLNIARNDAAPAAVRDMAGDIAAQITAQPLAGAVSEGQYLQLPLPHGASAEVLITDDHADGEGRGSGPGATTARILLELPHIGRVEIDAIVAADATMARISADQEGSRVALAAALPELRKELAGRGDVHIQITPTDPPHSLLPPPPPLGLEMEA